MVVAWCTLATITSSRANLRNAWPACWANRGSGFENASSGHRQREDRGVIDTVGQLEVRRPGQTKRHQLLLLATGFVAGAAAERAD